jgi:hypothetical protein
VAIFAYSTKKSNLHKTPTPWLVRREIDVKKKGDIQVERIHMQKWSH